MLFYLIIGVILLMLVGVPVALSPALLSLSSNRIVLLLLINLVLLVVGCFLDSIAAITIMTPVPIAMALGLAPVQFGVMVVLNLMIGLLTPPLGMVLYVLSSVSGIKR